ncbi:MAG: rod shape-determining protein MreC [Lachnospiraceae bacterium]|nr:rod shape-determining protein MreC [Lachnospiraceae bacterium]
MRRRGNDQTTERALLMVLSLLCAVFVLISVTKEETLQPIRNITGFVVTPMQRGISALGHWLSGISDNFVEAASLRTENEELREQVDTLTAENSQLVLDKEELARLRSLLELSKQYADYETIGARVISKDAGNWFSTFTIDKGTADGIQVNCNVLAGSGLVGIVTSVGPHWATIRSIIDDNRNVSAMISTTSDTCIIAGNLELIDSGALDLVKLNDENNRVHVGDKVVTSNISEKYLPGILIGYISELNNDANNLTKSGLITPVVDFRHMQEVLVIKERKEYVISTGSETGELVDDVPENAGEGKGS